MSNISNSNIPRFDLNTTYLNFLNEFSRDLKIIIPDEIIKCCFNDKGQMDWLLNGNIVFVTHSWNDISHERSYIPKFNTEDLNSNILNAFKFNNNLIIPLELRSNTIYHSTSLIRKIFNYFQKNLHRSYLNDPIIRNILLPTLKANAYWKLRMDENFPDAIQTPAEEFLEKNSLVCFKKRKLL